MRRSSLVLLTLLCAMSAAGADVAGGAPYPPSKIITKMTWDSNIVRVGAAGNSGNDGAGDNWPISWADDGNLYTTYGDGPGFNRVPKVEMTIGFARIKGDPPAIIAEDILSNADTPGGGGGKGSNPVACSWSIGPCVCSFGIIIVDGVLTALPPGMV